MAFIGKGGVGVSKKGESNEGVAAAPFTSHEFVVSVRRALLPNF
jgi:hypothetical protein